MANGPLDELPPRDASGRDDAVACDGGAHGVDPLTSTQLTPEPLSASLTAPRGHREPVIVDDRTLVAQLRAGEANAIAILFERYYDALCAFAIAYTSSEAEAEEIVHDVFLRVWTLREKLEIHDSVRSYLYSATRNRALNHVQRRHAERRWIDRARANDPAPAMGQAIPPADESLQYAELVREVAAAIERLPPRSRQVFLLHRQHGLTYVEIGAALDISPRTVENLIARAVRQLRAQLAHLVRE